MKKIKVNKLSKEQAIKDLNKYKKDLLNLRFQKVNSEIKDYSKINAIKKNIARLKHHIGAKNA
tara:strand:- start:417 stop:605 length:189 start_codon:yes stop_codon:yes gene_type:complete